MSSRLPGALTVQNQINFVLNFVLVFLEKKFSPQVFVKHFCKTIHNLRIKMLYPNHRKTFVLYYQIFTWVKFHIYLSIFHVLHVYRFRQIGVSPKTTN